MSDNKNKKSEEKTKMKPIIIRSSTDLQRLRLERLMKNPEKPVLIAEKPKERGVPVIPDFVRNVMGSSAGAGSGEFHVYRHLRRKEYARQKYMKEKAEREKLDEEHQAKLQENKKKADEKTAKKRAKRLKKKQRARSRAKKAKVQKESESEVSESESGTEDEVAKHESETTDPGSEVNLENRPPGLETNDICVEENKRDDSQTAENESESTLPTNDDSCEVQEKNSIIQENEVDSEAIGEIKTDEQNHVEDCEKSDDLCSKTT